nr:EOG090X09KD [Eulimnadia texana]
MPCWYFDKKDIRNSPSSQDGIDYETECRYRREGARFIIDTGTKMGLRYDTMATGVVYFHRFYMFHSFKEFPRYVTACCCLFLAGKVEETPKKCKDIIKIARGLVTESQFAQFGEDPKEEVMTLEKILLQTIRFDLQVEHPYSFVIKFAKSLKGEKSKLQKMVQMAWTFVNDSLCTTLCLQWEPEVIAIALIYLAGKLTKFEVQDWSGRQPRHLRWWDMFVEDIGLEVLEDICHQVLDLYSQPQSNRGDSPPPGASAGTPAKAPITPAPQQPQQPAIPTTPTVAVPPPSNARNLGFEQRIDAMKPSMDVTASAVTASYVNYAMGVAASASYAYNYTMIPAAAPPAASQPVPSAGPPPQYIAPPPPPVGNHAAQFYPQFPAQMYPAQPGYPPPIPPTPTQQPPPPPRPY